MSQAVFTQVLAEAAQGLARHGRLVLCQIVRSEGSTPGKPGWKLLVYPDGATTGNLGGGAFEALVIADARAKLAVLAESAAPPVGNAGAGDATSELKRYYFTEKAVRGEPTGMVCGGMAEVFLEVLAAAPLLVVCGGGPVGQALARAAELAGFDLLIAEDRQEYRARGLFPGATALAEVDRRYAQDFLGPWQARDLYVAIVSRCWETDAAALSSVLRQAPPRLRYLGVMGSRRKIERVRREVEARGQSLAGVTLHAPIGLPIGGDSPGEIAISIVAEMVQARRAGESRALAARSLSAVR